MRRSTPATRAAPWRVVGVNTAMIGQAQGLCFAIGSDTAVDVTTRLMRDGRVRRARLGLGGQTTMLDPRLARRLRREGGTAVTVSELMAEGSAARAGLMTGDVMLEFAGQPVFSVDDLHRALTADVAGSDIAVMVLRRAKLETLTVRPDLDD
jgi:S1-C subfamily serine protease